MIRWILVGTLFGCVIGCCAAVAGTAGVGGNRATAECAETNPVSVFSTPSGNGDPLTACYLYGGTVTDAAITLTFIGDAEIPVVGYPAEDLWLVSEFGGMIACAGATIADANTDIDGKTTWTGAFAAGGHSDFASGEGCQVLINGDALVQVAFPIYFNSADLTGDLVVDLTDVAVFAGDYFGVCAYRSDFYWDGVLDIADIVKFVPAFGDVCP